jgi:hypothetical protein
MINTSVLVLILGLLYHYMSLASGVQTIRPSWPGPVSDVLAGAHSPAVFHWSICNYL